MNRRRFLSFMGLAPVAAALPAMALPRPDNVKDIVTGEAGPELVLPIANIGHITAGTLRTRSGIEMNMQTGEMRYVG